MTNDYLELQPGSACFFHKDEVPKDTDYLQCFECGHSYPTERNLQEEWAANHPDGKSVDDAPPAAEIWFCPICIHDF